MRRSDNRYAGSPSAHSLAYLFRFDLCHHSFFIILSWLSEVKIKIGKKCPCLLLDKLVLSCKSRWKLLPDGTFHEGRRDDMNQSTPSRPHWQSRSCWRRFLHLCRRPVFPP